MIRYHSAGIDMSAYYFDCCVVASANFHEKRFTADPAGFELFSAWLLELEIKHCWAGIEHTGGYEQALAKYLLKNGHRVSLLSGFKVLRHKEMEGKRSKTDKGDARAIAGFVKKNKPALWSPRPDSFLELLELKNHRDSLVRTHTAWLNKRSAPKTSEYAHAQQDTLIEVIRVLIEDAEKQILTCIESDSDIQRCISRMDTVTGVGVTTATAFLAESGPLNRKTYPTPESLSLAAGLAPLPWMSGISVKGTYTKPYGNSKMRSCLNLPASIARRTDPALGLFAKRLEQRGKSKAVQNRAVKRKLVHILWAVAVNDEDYDPEKAVSKHLPKRP